MKSKGGGGGWENEMTCVTGIKAYIVALQYLIHILLNTTQYSTGLYAASLSFSYTA